MMACLVMTLSSKFSVMIQCLILQLIWHGGRMQLLGNISNPVLLDALVSTGVPGAEAGTLTFMVGGPEESYEAAKPLFQAMGKYSTYCGTSGNGVSAYMVDASKLLD